MSKPRTLMKAVLTLLIRLKPGQCRWCGCTYDDPCPPGCRWADRQQTLCTACVEFDKTMRSAAGRRRAVDAYNIGVETVEDR